MTAPGLAERFLFGEQKGKGKTTPHTHHYAVQERQGPATFQVKTTLHDFSISKTNQTKSTRKHMLKSPPTALSSPLVLVFALAMYQTVKLNHRMQQNKARTWKRRMQQKNIRKIPRQVFLDKIYCTKEISTWFCHTWQH